ncbi:MAG: hypothetical protein K2X49_23660 [Acetobacteraceae bacterium]|nr:hypothetical protein [Acetobacteraceae bacterium]
MSGSLFSLLPWPFGGGTATAPPKPDALTQKAEAKWREFEEQKKLLDATYIQAQQVDTGLAEQEKAVADAKKEIRFVKLAGSGQFVVNALSNAISDWPHDTTGETNSELVKDMHRRIGKERTKILDAQKTMEALKQQQVTFATWKEIDEARMRRLCNEVANLPKPTGP